MPRFIEGQDRQQVTLLPECLDDFVAEDNTVRIVDVFIGELDLVALGFEGASPASTGRPSYHPSVMLKLYLCAVDAAEELCAGEVKLCVTSNRRRRIHAFISTDVATHPSASNIAP